MLRYASSHHGHVDPASNQYEEPRPPRRGQHRPELGWSTYSPSHDPETSWRVNTPSLKPGFSITSSLNRSVSSPRFLSRTFCNMEKQENTINDSFGGRNFISMDRFEPQMAQFNEQHMHQQQYLPLADPSPVSWIHGAEEMSNTNITKDAVSMANQEELRMSLKRYSQTERPMSTIKKYIADANNYITTNNSESPNRSILEEYARTMALSYCHTFQKRCIYQDCGKISVSRGLCRRHGGGRRCHSEGCTKSAQSRSNFCWAHGGGQRCEVEHCMRSRKSKRFCVAHLSHEKATNSATSTIGNNKPKDVIAPISNTSKVMDSTEAPKTSNYHSYTQDGLYLPRKNSSLPRRYLPSLGQALSSASRSPPNLPVRTQGGLCC